MSTERPALYVGFASSIKIAEEPTPESTSDVATIIKSLSDGKSKDFRVDRSQIPVEQLKVLDRFAAESVGEEDCKTEHVNGCNSCCADGVSGSLRVTTCGNFCDKVYGAEPCH